MNMSASTHDCLIIGQGLAGSLLARELLAMGQRVLVVDDHHQSSSSTIAGGLINPVTGKRLSLQPGIDYLLPAAQRLYRTIEQKARRRFFYPLPMLRIFQDDQERVYFQRRMDDPAYAPYMQPLPATDLLRDTHAPFGGCIQTHTGFLRLAEMLEWLRDEFMIANSFVRANFRHEDLTVGASGIEWNGHRATSVIFCEGFRGALNPWFSQLPFQLARGEIIDGMPERPLHPHDHIINAGRWLLPEPDGRYRFGATMEWDNIDTHVTEDARQALADAFHERFPDIAFTVTGQRAGVRPATTDRHPFIGSLPAQPAVMIFNGFGAKGGLLIPWYARQFANHLVNGEPLDPAADIRRYDKTTD
jgi:glycine oxidase